MHSNRSRTLLTSPVKRGKFRPPSMRAARTGTTSVPACHVALVAVARPMLEVMLDTLRELGSARHLADQHHEIASGELPQRRIQWNRGGASGKRGGERYGIEPKRNSEQLRAFAPQHGLHVPPVGTGKRDGELDLLARCQAKAAALLLAFVGRQHVGVPFQPLKQIGGPIGPPGKRG
jgi:hypothetical protein